MYCSREQNMIRLPVLACQCQCVGQAISVLYPRAQAAAIVNRVKGILVYQIRVPPDSEFSVGELVFTTTRKLAACFKLHH